MKAKVKPLSEKVIFDMPPKVAEAARKRVKKDDDVAERRREIVSSFKGPRSLCICGHLGDGPGIHAGPLGHGHCLHGEGKKVCRCPKFTWASWSPELSKKLEEEAGYDLEMANMQIDFEQETSVGSPPRKKKP